MTCFDQNYLMSAPSLADVTREKAQPSPQAPINSSHGQGGGLMECTHGSWMHAPFCSVDLITYRPLIVHHLEVIICTPRHHGRQRKHHSREPTLSTPKLPELIPPPVRPLPYRRPRSTTLTTSPSSNSPNRFKSRRPRKMKTSSTRSGPSYSGLINQPPNGRNAGQETSSC